jgi:hypothetical protein
MSVINRLTTDQGGFKPNRDFFVFWGGILFAVVLLIGAISPKAPPQSAAEVAAARAAMPLNDPSWSSVCAVTQVEIEDRLKSPGSGSFEGCRMVSVSDDKKKVVVMGYVTATNAFNAKIRQQYAAIVVRKPDAPRDEDHSSTWNVAKLTIGD